MIYNVISSLKIIYPLVQDQARLQLISEKLDQWIAINEEKIKTVQATLTVPVKTTVDKAKSWKLINLEKLPLDEKQKNASLLFQAKLTYYKTAQDFINNQFFSFTSREFYTTVLSMPTCDKAQLNKMLAENNCEAEDALITDYLTDWASKKARDHLKFFNNLTHKINNEDAKTSREMAALLFFKVLLNEYAYFSLDSYFILQRVNGDPTTLSLHDFTYLLGKHLLASKKLEDPVLSLLNKFIPALERAATLEDGNEDKETRFTHAISSQATNPAYVELSGLFASMINCSASNEFLLQFISSKKELLDQLNPNISTKTGNGGTQPFLLSILKIITQNKVIFTNLMNADFFKKAKVNDQFVKTNKLNAQSISTLLYNVTNININIWTQLNPLLFDVIEEKEARELYRCHPTLIGTILIEKILFLSHAIDVCANGAFQDAINRHEPIGKNQFANSIKTVSYCDSLENQLISTAMEKPEVLEVVLAHDEFISYLRSHLVENCVVLYTNGTTAEKMRWQEMASKLDSLHEKGKKEKLWDKLWSASLFSQIRSMRDGERKLLLSPSKVASAKYKAELDCLEGEKKSPLQTPGVVNKKDLRREANKQLMAERQKKESEQKSASQVKPAPQATLIKSLLPQPKSAAAPTHEKTTLTLTPEQRKAFTDSICAVVAGNSTLHFKWGEPKQNDPEYFIVNFADLGNEFKILKPSRQDDDDTWVTLTDEKRDNFINTFVPANLETYLGNSMAITPTPDGLRITPKTNHCLYPEDLHTAALYHLNKHGNVVKKQKTPTQTSPMHRVRHKKNDPYRSLLSKPIESTAKTNASINDAQKATSSSTAPESPLNNIKKMWIAIVQDIFPQQHFNFLKLKEDKNRFLIKINPKAVSCLSNQETRFDTYIFMKSIVATLQEKYGKEFITLQPADELDPEKYKNVECSIAIKASKNELQSIATDASQHPDLKKSFATFLEIYNGIAHYYTECKACERAIQGRASPVMVVINEPLEVQDPICKSYQNLTIKNDQRACLHALFDELKSITPLLEKYKNDASRLLATKSRQIICYHRIFHNLAWVFHDNHHRMISLFARTLRDTYRHGYFKMPPELTQFIEKLSLSLMAYRKGASLPSSHLYSQAATQHQISFDVTQSMHDELTVKLKTFLQEKWNHIIGLEFKGKRVKLAEKLKSAIEEISAATDIPELEKQSMIVAMASRVGESDKTSKVYATVYGQLGTHDYHLTMLPELLTTEVYHEFVYGKRCECR